MQYDIVEFVVNNKEQINSHLSDVMVPMHVAARIFDNFPEHRDEYLSNHEVQALTRYLLEHFPQENYETISCVINPEFILAYLS